MDTVISTEGLLVALVVFGLAPGLLLRVIVRAFSKGDPRRQELRAELYAVPRLERPLWVVEQIEVAIFEGLWGRFMRVAAGRVIDRWHLRSGVKAHAKYPETFLIPSEAEKAALQPGMIVKLSFEMRRGGERMWVEITDVAARRLVGKLLNTPVDIPRLEHGDRIRFQRDHVLDIVTDPDPSLGEPDQWEAGHICPCCADQRNDGKGDPTKP